MATTAVNLDKLNGAGKRRYDKFLSALPEWTKLQRMFPFQKAKRIGEAYHYTVKVQQGWGGTFANSSSTFPVTMAVSRSFLTKDANVKGYFYTSQRKLDMLAVSRAYAAGPAAFFSTFDQAVKDLRDEEAFLLELALLYGQDSTGIGVISADPGSASGSGTEAAPYYVDVVLSAATWAPGIWSKAVGMPVDVFSSDLGTQRTDASGGEFYVGSVTHSTRTVRLHGIGTGTNTDLGDITTNDVIIPRGWYAGGTWHVMMGLTAIAQTDDKFGIDAAVYPTMRGNNIQYNGRLTYATVHKATMELHNRGCEGTVQVLVPTASWVDMANDASALREYDTDQKSGVSYGTTKLTFHGVNGKMEIISHPLLKSGEFLVLKKEDVKRIGSTPVTFDIPGAPDKFVHVLPSESAYQIRLMSDQAIIHVMPKNLLRGYGLTPSSLS